VTRHQNPSPSTAPASSGQASAGPVPRTQLFGLDAVQLRAEIDRLCAELVHVRRERDQARQALSWIDFLEAVEVLAEAEDLADEDD
jgi:hypothetical protein